MQALKAAIRRAAAALTGEAQTRETLAKLRTRLDAASTSTREAVQRLKSTAQEARDGVIALQRRTDEDRRAILDAINRLHDEQRTLRAELAALTRLHQRTYLTVVDSVPFDEGALDRDAMTRHVRHAVLHAPMQTTPFPHLVVPDLLPARFYDQLLRAIPAPTFWRDAGYQRENWHVEEDRASRLSETTWRFMHRDVAAGVMMPALLERFAEPIARYWHDVAGIDPSLLATHYHCDEGRLLLRRPGYELEPHLDPPTAILTVLLFLAEPGAPEAHGTDLYASGPLPAMRDGIMYPARQGITVEYASTVPFRPNTALAFVTPQSVHGATLPTTVDARFERISYQFLVCLDQEGRRILRKKTGRQAAGTAAAY
jgi:hypothetical protein